VPLEDIGSLFFREKTPDVLVATGVRCIPHKYKLANAAHGWESWHSAVCGLTPAPRARLHFKGCPPSVMPLSLAAIRRASAREAAKLSGLGSNTDSRCDPAVPVGMRCLGQHRIANAPIVCHSYRGTDGTQWREGLRSGPAACGALHGTPTQTHAVPRLTPPSVIPDELDTFPSNHMEAVATAAVTKVSGAGGGLVGRARRGGKIARAG
jgi:hypothetical protein